MHTKPKLELVRVAQMVLTVGWVSGNLGILRKFKKKKHPLRVMGLGFRFRFVFICIYLVDSRLLNSVRTKSYKQSLNISNTSIDSSANSLYFE